MTALSSVTPRSDLAGYLASYAREMAFGDSEAGAVLDRYHTPDIEYYSDGLRFDREKLIAHARPARKNAVSARIEVHDALVSGDRVAARYTLEAVTRKGPVVVIEIYMFGQLAPDGRLRRIDSITRTLPDSSD
jgi:hypothetical protein